MEQYLNRIATGEGEYPAEPHTNVEQYLNYIIENGIGGGGEARVVDKLPAEGETGYIYLVLKEQTASGDIYDEWIWALQQDGTSYDWEHLGATNEVTIEIDDAMSDSSENAVQNKVIKSYVDTGLSGKQSTLTAGEGIDITNAVITATNTGKAKVLTSVDYDYPNNNPTGIAMWLLEPGVYILPTDVVGYTQTYFNTPQTAFKGTWLVARGSYGGLPTSALYLFNGADKPQYYTAKLSDGSRIHGQTFFTTVVNNLTSTSTSDALSANQGKTLKNLVDSLAIRGAGAPATTTVGQVGTLYEDTTNSKLYICTDATNPYVWEEVGGASIETISSQDWSDLWQ